MGNLKNIHIREIKYFLCEGLTLEEIAETYNSSTSNISAIKNLQIHINVGRKYNPKLRKLLTKRKKSKRLSTKEIEVIIEIIKLGYKQIAIARLFKVSYATITNVKKKHL